MNKKKKWAKRFLLARAVCRPFVAHLARKEYGFKIPKITLPDGPALIFCNHVTTYDPLLIVAAFKKPCHIVVAKDFIRMKWRKSVQKWFSPIWKDKSLQDPAVPMEIIRYLRAGESVMVFPEGNRTFSSRLCYIGESTAKLARSCRSDILFLNIIGGFTVDPRFSLDFRKGQMEIVYRGMLKKEDVAKMELEEILEKIKENPFQGKELGRGLRKVRFGIADKGGGKSGGMRVITFSINRINEDNVEVTFQAIFNSGEERLNEYLSELEKETKAKNIHLLSHR